MSTKTKNLNLIKPEENDHVNIKDINDNMDKIDEKVVTLETLQKELEKQKIKDTGWITVDTFFNGCTHYGASSKVRVRQYGNVVSIIGTIGNSKVLSTKSTGNGLPVVEMFKLPDEIEVPMEDIRFVQQGSGLNRFSLVINYNTRKVSIERYGTTSVIDVPVNQWLNVTCSYMVGD
jgi:hypothetical protein|nr:MAG TPA: hypothetical protein [Caudoviricetes sp.]